MKRTTIASLFLLMPLGACGDSNGGATQEPGLDVGDWTAVVFDGGDTAGDTAVGPDVEVDVAPEPDVPLADSATDVQTLGDGVDVVVGNDADGSSVDVTQDIPLGPIVSPAEPGPFAFDFHAVSAEGDGASFEAELYVPTGTEPMAVVILLPGFTLAADAFSETSKRLASHGFVVLSPSFDDGIFSPIDHADLADHTSSFFDWLLAEHQTDGGPVFGRVDGDRLGVAGHSRGGKVALLCTTEDDRIKAAYGLDPVDTVGGPFSGGPTPENPSVTPELMDLITVPLGLFGAGKGGEGLQPCAPEEENHEAYYEAADGAPVVYHHVDPEGGHMDFTDSGAAGFCSGGEDPAATRAAATSVLVAFFRLHLNDEPGVVSWLTGDDVDPRLVWESK